MARTVLTASEGFVMTDGEIYGTKIYLAAGMSPEAFREISLDEYERIMEQEQEALMQEDATDADHIVREV